MNIVSKKNAEIAHIVAVSSNGVIGNGMNIPWNIPEDMARFKYLTMGKPVIIGRKTFETLPKNLIGRQFCVLSKELSSIDGAIAYNSLDAVLGDLRGKNKIMIAGGAEIYRESIDLVNAIYITLIHENYEGSHKYIEYQYIKKHFKLDYKINFDQISENGLKGKHLPSYSFCRYVKKINVA